MKNKISTEFIAQIPKADLHVHLDGSLRLSTLIELAKASGVELPAYTEKGLRETVFKKQYASLTEYLKGFSYTTAVLQKREHLVRVAYELAQDALAEGVRYMEVRFAPQLHAGGDMSIAEAVRAVAEGLQQAEKEHNQTTVVKTGKDLACHFGIITCAMRTFNGQMSPYYKKLTSVLSQCTKPEIYGMASLELARRVVRLVHEEKLPVVGFDLAGAEAGYPASDHIQAYAYVHKHFIRKTVHSGEAYGPESIFSAITDCYANRIGHGTHLFDADLIKDRRVSDKQGYVDNLADYIASQRISVEVCLTSNLQTLPEITSISKHPVKEMIRRGLPVSIATDNRLVSHTTVSRELELLVKHIPLTAKEFKNIVIAGFKGAFFPGNYMEKRTFVRQVINRYDELSAKYLR